MKPHPGLCGTGLGEQMRNTPLVRAESASKEEVCIYVHTYIHCVRNTACNRQLTYQCGRVVRKRPSIKPTGLQHVLDGNEPAMGQSSKSEKKTADAAKNWFRCTDRRTPPSQVGDVTYKGGGVRDEVTRKWENPRDWRKGMVDVH